MVRLPTSLDKLQTVSDKLKHDYCAMTEARLRADAPLFADIHLSSYP